MLLVGRELVERADRSKRLYWLQVDVVKRLLQHVVPRNLTSANEVAVAGSAALHRYLGQINAGPFRTDIGDFDIFVAGGSGSTNGSFRSFVLAVLGKIKDIL